MFCFPGESATTSFLVISVALLVLSGCASSPSGSSDDDSAAGSDDTISGDDSQDDTENIDDDTHPADDSSDDSGPDDDIDDTADDDTAVLCVPPGGAPRSALRAGVAAGDLYAPIGTSMGGFGGRPGPRHPYTVIMGASTGYIGRPNVKAVALDNGETRVVIARIPAVGITEVLYRKTLARICEISGVDLNGRLWISATHTHSGPTHYLPAPPVLGDSGMDVYDEGFTDRIADSIAQAARQSMENLEPAALDATIVTDFDPDDLWSQDRRCQNNPPSYKEDRVFLARIDRLDGSPMSALVGMADHGVYMGETLMEPDVPGAVEYGLQKTFGSRVEVLFLQGAAGDVNPVGAPNPLNDEQSLEWYSQSLGPVLRSIFDGLAPESDVTLAMATKPQPISRAEIGYADDEYGWYDLSNPPEFHLYEDGSFYCGASDVWNFTDFFRDHGSVVDCNDLSTTLVDGYYGCVLPLLFIDAWWTWASNPTEIAAVRLGDYLLALLPGELTSFLSKRLRERLEAETGVADSHIATFGYSNAYQLYLLTEWDWLQGGYETSISFWGPKFGDWLADRDVDLAKTLYAAEPPETYPIPAIPTMPWPDFLPDGYEPGQTVGATLDQAHTAYERFETVRYSWAGGFTGIDPHRVYFEKETPDGFAQVLLPDGRPLTDAGMETVLTYEASPDYETLRFPAAREHRYAIEWELTADVPAGRYRVRVEGSTWTGSATAYYTAISDAFEIAPAGTLSVRNLSVEDEGGGAYRLSCDAYWPPNPAGRRLRRMGYGMNDWPPVRGGSAAATIEIEGEPEETVLLTGSESGHYEGDFLMTHAGRAHAARIRAGDLTDEYGNTSRSESGPIPFP